MAVAVAVPPPYESIEWGEETMQPIPAYDVAVVESMVDEGVVVVDQQRRFDALRILGKHVNGLPKDDGEAKATVVARWMGCVRGIVEDSSGDDLNRQLSTLIACRLAEDVEVSTVFTYCLYCWSNCMLEWGCWVACRRRQRCRRILCVPCWSDVCNQLLI